MLKLVLLAIIAVLSFASAKKAKDIAKDNQGKSGDMASSIFMMSIGSGVLTLVVFVLCLLHHMQKK